MPSYDGRRIRSAGLRMFRRSWSARIVGHSEAILRSITTISNGKSASVHECFPLSNLYLRRQVSKSSFSLLPT